MKKLLSIIIACGAGGFFGTLIGFHFFHSLSIIGGIVALVFGGFIGYFLYDFEEVIAAIKRAWKKITVPKLPLSEEELLKRKKAILLFQLHYLASLKAGFFNAIIAIFQFVIIIVCLKSTTDTYTAVVSVLILLYSCSFASSEKDEQDLAKRLDVNGIQREISDRKSRLGITSHTSTIVQWLLLNPLIMPFCIIIIGIASLIIYVKENWLKILINSRNGIIWFITGLFRIIGKGLKLIVYVFTYVHSDRRLLCLCDSALGTAIGLVWQSPFIGLAAGAVSGLVSYQLISVKLLKLQFKH